MRTIVTGLLAVFAFGCSPLLYLPPNGTMAQLQRTGDLHARTGVGFHGWNLSGAYAVTNHVAVRAGGATDFSTSSTDARHFGQVGVGGFWAPAADDLDPYDDKFPSGLRVGAAVDVGLGAASDSGSYSIGRTRHDFLGSITYLRSVLESEISYESEYVGVGVIIRATYLSATPTPANRDATEAQWLLAEPLVALRVGPPKFKVDLQAGFMLPLTGQGDVGLWWPFVIQMGFSGDFEVLPRPRRPAPPPEPLPVVDPAPAPVLPADGTPPPMPPLEPGAAPIDVPASGDGPPPTPAPEPSPPPPPL